MIPRSAICNSVTIAAESIQSDEIVPLIEPPADDLQHESACYAAMSRLLQTPSPQRSGAENLSPGDSLNLTIEPRQTLGPYRILGTLGSGGMSAVLLGEHERLVRTALRSTGEVSSVWQTTPPAAASGPPPRPRIGAWLAGGLFAAAILAAIIFKIQTERGELVVHSELGGLTLVVTQGDELVERLQISSDADNRIVLRKGSYRVAIEGGGEALKLSEEVVTIGRGAPSTLEIKPKAAANVAISASPPAIGQELYQGHGFTHWMRTVRFERDLPTVCHAMQAVQTLAKSPEQQLEAAEATLRLARRWGSTVLTDQTGTESEQGRANIYMSRLYTSSPPTCRRFAT